MAKHLIVVDRIKDWHPQLPEAMVIAVDDYLSDPRYLQMRQVQVINLCRSYRYQSAGYYCSLLAEARGHRVLPGVNTLLDLSARAIYSLQVEGLEGSVHKTLRKLAQPEPDRFILDIFFGECVHRELRGLARQLFETFPCPLLQVIFQHKGGWQIESIRPLALNRLDGEQTETLAQAFSRYQSRRWRSPRTRTASRYDLAILHNPDDPLPPSDARALKLFVKAGSRLGVDVDLITRRDYARLAEYDALFIRDTTRINHYTFRFAKKADSEGMVVIDDPVSIMRCTNKVYLAELLQANRLPTPLTRILHRHDEKRVAQSIERQFDYPVVLKVPDGSFSLGVFKAEDRAELQQICARMFRDSELILAQEYLYTEFDWRVGILNRTPVFVCQYFMSRQHWQIVNHGPEGRFSEGGYKAWPVDEAPAEVVSVALQAANLIGDGLYGVDVKQNKNGVYVIEVNDNPNLEAGVEDAFLKDELYSLILREFVRRLEMNKVLGPRFQG